MDIGFKWCVFLLILKEFILTIHYLVNNQLSLNDNCFEFIQESENNMAYSEAQDHCENLNGTLLNENRLEDVKNVCKYFTFTFRYTIFSFH